MSAISVVRSLGEIVPMTGIGEGEGKGRILFRWKERTAQLLHLTIERGEAAVSGFSVGKKVDLQWKVLRTLEGPVLIESAGFERAFQRAFPEEPTDVTTIIQDLFEQVALSPTLSPRAGGCCQAQLDSTRAALEADVEGIVEHSVCKSPHTRDELRGELENKIARTLEWAECRLSDFLTSVPWHTCNWIKIPGLPFPTRCFFNRKKGTISVDITPGVIETGFEKNIKSVIRLFDGEVERLVRATPIKKTSDEELNLILKKRLSYEAAVSVSLIKEHVPNIISIWSEDYDKEGLKKHRYMMERCEIDLLEHVKQRLGVEVAGDGSPTPEDVKEMIRCQLMVLDTLRHMHALHWIHRDLKPENVLLKGGVIRVTDFSLAVREGDRVLMGGTAMYLAPEIFLAGGEIEASPTMDMWSFGAMLYVCTSFERNPFGDIHRRLHKSLLGHRRKANDLLDEQDRALAATEVGDSAAIRLVNENYGAQLELLKYKEGVEMQKLLDELIFQIEDFRRKLQEKPTLLQILISDLLRVAPSGRPTAEEAYTWLMAIYQRMR